MDSNLVDQVNDLAKKQNRNFSNMLETLLLERLEGINYTSLK